jgi:hypothetical protein
LVNAIILIGSFFCSGQICFRAPRKIDVMPPIFGQKKAALEAAGEEKEIVISE